MWDLDFEGMTAKFKWDIRAVSSGQQRGCARSLDSEDEVVGDMPGVRAKSCGSRMLVGDATLTRKLTSRWLELAHPFNRHLLSIYSI